MKNSQSTVRAHNFVIIAAILTGAALVSPGEAMAQRASIMRAVQAASQNQQPETLPRRANDQIEGTVWEYRSIEYKMQLEPGEPEPQIDGRIRIEGNAVFDANPVINIAPRTERADLLQRFVRGEGIELAAPAGPEEKRIGEYRRLDNGKIRFEFNDPDSLNGVMLAWPKEDAPGVWLANYFQHEGGQTTGKWLLEIRAVED